MTCKHVKRKLSVLMLILAAFTMAGCVSVHSTETHRNPSEHKTTWRGFASLSRNQKG